MLKSKSFFISATSLFLVAETFLGVLIHTSSGRSVNFFQFLSIIIAALFFVLFVERSANYLLTQCALIFTVIADYFLVWISPQIKLAGMVFFLAAQIFYAVRIFISTENKFFKRLQLALRLLFTVLIIFITSLVLGDKTDALSLISMAYYVNIFLNLIFTFVTFKKNYLLAFGFLLFILCDTIIGLTVLKEYMPFEGYNSIYHIIYPGFDLSWAFYLPSQMLLAVSLLPDKLNSIKKADSI